MDRTFVGGVGAWADPASWIPDGAPATGDVLTVTEGTVFVADETLDSQTLLLGSTDPAVPASLSLSEATLAAGFTQTADVDTPDARLSLVGTVTLAGTFDESAPNGVTAIDLASGALVTLSGTLSVSNGDDTSITGDGTFDDEDNITVSGGTLEISANTALSAHATITIAAGGTLVLDGPAPAGLTINFADGSGTLVIGDSQYFTSSVTGFQNGDTIVFAGTLGTVAHYVGGTLTVLTGHGDDTDGTEIARFSISGPAATGQDDPLHRDDFFLARDAQNNTILSYSVQRHWVGGTGDWYAAANWTNSTGASGTPGVGDTAIIAAGTATIATSGMNQLDAEKIVLSTAQAGLQIENGSLGSGLTITARFSAPSDDGSSANLSLDGTTTLNGRLTAENDDTQLALTIGKADDGAAGHLTVSATGSIEINDGAAIDLQAGELTNNGTISVSGSFTIEQPATVDGGGTILLDASQLDLSGTIGTAQHVEFGSAGDGDDDSTLVIEAGGSFGGIIDDFSRGDEIDLAGVQATGVSFDQSTGRLSLLDAAGATVTALQLSGSYVSGDFSLSALDGGGTAITEASAAQPLDHVTYITLPVPVLVVAGGTETLAQILDDAFGSGAAARYGQAIVTAGSAGDMGWAAYWNLADPAVPTWSMDGAVVPADTYRAVAASDWGDTVLTAGNAIEATAEVLLPSRWLNGAVAAYTAYNIEIVDPALFSQPAVPPTAASIVSAAETLGAAYVGTPNSEDCYNIAAAVSAATGASFGPSMADTNPSKNAAAGFWRIAYAAPQNGSAIKNWSSLVRAGDVLRIGWYDENNHKGPGNDGPHSFTVLSGLQADGTISVLDNGYGMDASGITDDASQIGIHDVDYWTQTDPRAISIFRIDPNAEYLITGTALQQLPASNGELLQGNGWNDLFIPGEDRDTLVLGTGTDIVADTAAHLNGAVIDDLGDGDSIDVTDLAAVGATTDYDPVQGRLTLSAAGDTVEMAVARGLTGRFVLAADGGSAGLDGGTLGSLYAMLFPTGGTGTRITFEASAPGTPVLAMPTGAGATIDPAALALSGTADPGTEVTVSVSSTVLGTGVTAADGVWTVTLSSAVPDGTSPLQLTETNGLDAVSAPANLIVSRDAAGIALQDTDGSGVVHRLDYDADGHMIGMDLRTATADGGTSTQHLAPDGTLLSTTTTNAAGWTTGISTATTVTRYGYDAGGTATATAVTSAIDPTGPATVTDGSDGAVVTTAVGGHTTVTLLGGNNTVLAQGEDTIAAGSGDDTVTALAGASNVSVTGGTGQLRFMGAGAATVSGGAGSATIDGGAGGTYLGGSAGQNLITGAGHSLLWGGGFGDLLLGGASDVLGASNGNSTLVGGQGSIMVDATGTQSFAGAGDTVYGAGGGGDAVIGDGDFTAIGTGGQTTVFGGVGTGTTWAGASDLIAVAGTGQGTLVAGTEQSSLWIDATSGRQTVMAVKGAGGGSLDVTGFRPGVDRFEATGYPTGATSSSVGGSLTLTLGDHTRITFVGVTSLT